MASSLCLDSQGLIVEAATKEGKKKNNKARCLFLPQNYLMPLGLCHRQSGALKGKCHEKVRGGG